MMVRRVFLLMFALFLALVTRAGARTLGPLREIRKIAIGGEGGWDFLEVDAANRSSTSPGAPASSSSTSTPRRLSARSPRLRASTGSPSSPT